MTCGKRGLREPNGGRQRGMGGHARSGRPRVFPILSVLCSLFCGSCVANPSWIDPFSRMGLCSFRVSFISSISLLLCFRSSPSIPS